MIMNKIKIIFMGTPLFSVLPLEALIENYQVVAVVTQPDRKVGRHQEVIFSPVKKVALKHHIPVLQPHDITVDYQTILDLNPDLIITCAYGQILPKELLFEPKYKCINIHASLLPKLRGGAPIHRAIMEGHYQTGITIIQMTPKLDAGPIISQRSLAILETDNVGTLHNRLSQLAKELLLSTLPDFINNKIKLIKQKEREATYAWNIKKGEERINWDQAKRQIFNQVRGLNPWPVAYTTLDGNIIKIWEVVISDRTYFNKVNGEIVKLYEDGIGVKVYDGELIIKKLQPASKKMMAAQDYLNGIVAREKLIGRIFY
jgi:methionyl-tRNA formyltransferase